MKGNVTKLIEIFYKNAQILQPGQSTTTPERAFEIGRQLKLALSQIDEILLSQYQHENLKQVADMLANNELPTDFGLIRRAVDEFNSGIRSFSNMYKIPVNDLLVVMDTH